MKKLLAIAVLFFLNLNIKAQLYERGYYIDNNGHKVKGLVKLLDWKITPEEFYYKSNESGQEKLLSINDVKEFGSMERFKQYKRFVIEIDSSSDKWDRLSFNIKPEFKKDTLFMEHLVDGVLSLYFYDRGDAQRFFYQKEGEAPKQLIYKKYRTQIVNNETHEEETVVKENKAYILQLQDLMHDCRNISRDEYQIKYQKKPLKSLFVKYNQCKDKLYQKIKEDSFMDHLRMSLIGGIQFANLDFTYKPSSFSNTIYDIDFGNTVVPSFGVNIEYVMFFDKKRWSIFLEPSFKSFSMETTKEKIKFDLQYKGFSIPMGIQRTHYINNNHSVSLQLAYVFHLPVGDSAIGWKPDEYASYVDFDLNTGSSFMLSLGYKYKNKVGIFIRRYSKSDLMSWRYKSLFMKAYEVGLAYYFL